jgi:L-lactate dehydrogenase
MQTSSVKQRKVVVVGAGAVGATFVYALAQSALADEIALIDKNENLAHGQVMDLAHGQPYFPPVSIRVGGPADYADARLIVLTAGAPQRPGETRLELLQKNAAIVRQVVSEAAERNSAAVMIVVTNPVDVMAHVALKHTGWDRRRIMGSGTVLDSARLRYLLSAECGVDVHNVHGYVLGEHGDSQLVAWSLAHVGGIPIEIFCSGCSRGADAEATRDRIALQVRDSAYHIIDYKGATNFAVGLALVRIAGAVLRSQNSVLTVSTLLEGEYGLSDVCLSVPCVVSSKGVERIVAGTLPAHELAALHASAAVLKQAIAELASG